MKEMAAVLSLGLFEKKSLMTAVANLRMYVFERDDVQCLQWRRLESRCFECCGFTLMRPYRQLPKECIMECLRLSSVLSKPLVTTQSTAGECTVTY